ncbi:MAG: thiamine-binding protein [Ignavibacteria bacterium]|nr:thiamine-binding protein [Ignavibacteria bacterium]
MEKNIITCEISFLPLLTTEVNRYVGEVVNIIAKFGLKHEVGLISTIVEGSPESVYDLLKEISLRMGIKVKYSMIIKVSNFCGCE